MKAGDWITLFAVIVALGLGLTSLIQTQRLQKRERRERLLNEIIEWVVDIQKVSLEIDIPITCVPLTEEETRKIEANILRRYGIPLIRNNYIKAIVYKEFRDDLLKDIESMIKASILFICSSSKTRYINVDYIQDSFKGAEYKTVVDEFKRLLNEKSVQELWEKYAEEKAKYASIILTKVGDIMTSL